MDRLLDLVIDSDILDRTKLHNSVYFCFRLNLRCETIILYDAKASVPVFLSIE